MRKFYTLQQNTIMRTHNMVFGRVIILYLYHLCKNHLDGIIFPCSHSHTIYIYINTYIRAGTEVGIL